jgi:tetratricopeptide (TPR) repeat protein
VTRYFTLLAGLLVSLFLLAGCQTPPQTRALLLKPPTINKQHLIDDVPFYPQQQYYCGPTTLAEVAGYFNYIVSPEQIAPLTFVPGLQGSLQIEMVAATRQLGMVAYAQQGNLELLLALVANNIPIIVLQNNGIGLFPQWHYAVVIGYDLNTQKITLHTGVTPNHTLNFATFERTWQRGQYWMLAMLPTTTTDKLLSPFVYAKACQDLLDTGQIEAGTRALKSAIKQWPDYWLTYFLLANHYLEQSPDLAINWFKQGYLYGKNEVSYLNNYAYALGKKHCYDEAKSIIEKALMLAPDDENAMDTQRQLQIDSQVYNKSACPLSN